MPLLHLLNELGGTLAFNARHSQNHTYGDKLWLSPMDVGVGSSEWRDGVGGGGKEERGKKGEGGLLDGVS